MRCTQCALEQEAGSRFCLRCGAPLPQAEAARPGSIQQQVEALVGKANLGRARRDYTGAIRACQEALELDPAYPWAHVLLADLYADTQRTEEARQHLERAAQLQPGNPNIAQKLARLAGREAGRAASRPSSPDSTAPEVVAAVSTEAESLRLAHSLKEKTDKLLARLEELRINEQLADDEYGGMRTRYQDAVLRANTQIEKLKATLGRRRDHHEQEAQREGKALEQLEAEARARQLLDYQIADRREAIERRLAGARAQIEEITRVLGAESAEGLGGFVEVDLATGQRQAPAAPTPAAPMPASTTAAALCSSCGATIALGMRFCDQCGASLPSVAPAAVTPAAPVPSNTSGLGPGYPVPQEAQRWNWGAFFMGLFWAPAHNLWGWFVVFLVAEVVWPAVSGVLSWALLGPRAFAVGPRDFSVLLGLDLVLSIILGACGGRRAWARRRFESVEHFCQVERIWGWVGLAYFLVNLIAFGLMWGAVGQGARHVISGSGRY